MNDLALDEWLELGQEILLGAGPPYRIEGDTIDLMGKMADHVAKWNKKLD